MTPGRITYLRARTRVGGVLAAALGAVLLLGGSAADAATGWQARFSLSGAGQITPDVAVGADGTAAVAWTDLGNTLVQLRVRAPNGKLSAIQPISPAGQNPSQPHVAVDAGGNVTVVWVDGGTGRNHLRHRRASGVLGPTQQLSATGDQVAVPVVTTDPAGNALAAWRNITTGQIEVRRRDVDGTLGAIQPVSSVTLPEFAQNPQIDSNAAGDALIVWEEAAPTPRIMLRRRDASGAFGMIRTLDSGGAIPDVAIDVRGDGVAVWKGNLEIEASRYTVSNDNVSPAQAVSPGGVNSSLTTVDVDPAGNAAIAWRNQSTNTVQGRRRSVAGALGPIETLSATGAGFGGLPDVAVDSGGNALVVWDHQSTNLVNGRRWTPAGALGPTGVLSGPASSYGNVDSDPRGNGLAVWRSTGTSTIQAAVYDAARPNTTITKKPKRRIRKRRASFRFTSNERGSKFQCRRGRKPFKRCRSPKRLRRLRPGRHRFQVRAVDLFGNVDRSPATWVFRVRRPPRP